MKRYLLPLVAVAIVGVLGVLMLSSVQTAQASGGRVISVFGKVPGTNLAVHVLAVVPPGRGASDVAREVLAAQGARPFDSADYSTTGLVWGQFSDGDIGNDFVTQYYNSGSSNTRSEPVDGGSALLSSQGTWSGVDTSTFAFASGTTTRCPSLVRECRGPQTLDGNNDVAWLALKGGNTLGVTWFTTSGTPEADMALNVKFNWSTGGGDFDVETVFLHENGHVAGLGHSDVTGAIMEAVYAGERRSLHQDDIAGITALYPAGSPNAAPSVTITSPADGATFASGESINFAASADDTEDGDVTASLVWTSSIDGSIGGGGSFSAALRDGAHTITASVTDSGGKSASDSITITVGSPPASGTTMSVDSITYSTGGGKNNDKHLSIEVAVIDDGGAAVAGATVTIELLLGGSPLAAGTATTGEGGTVLFSLKNAPSGTYTSEITQVTHANLEWDGVTPENSFTK